MQSPALAPPAKNRGWPKASKHTRSRAANREANTADPKFALCSSIRSVACDHYSRNVNPLMLSRGSFLDQHRVVVLVPRRAAAEKHQRFGSWIADGVYLPRRNR